MKKQITTTLRIYTLQIKEDVDQLHRQKFNVYVQYTWYFWQQETFILFYMIDFQLYLKSKG